MLNLRFLSFFLVTATLGFAQLTGRLSGTVTDPTGASVPDATVNLLLPNGTSPVLTTTTNQEGIFDFTAVRPDYYILTVETKGFAKFSMGNVKVDPARTLNLPAITLAVAGTALTVEVSAGVQTIDTATAEVSTTVT